jgi:hypothetical protein
VFHRLCPLSVRLGGVGGVVVSWAVWTLGLGVLTIAVCFSGQRIMVCPWVLKVVLGGLSLLCVPSILTSWAYLVRFPELPLPLLLRGCFSSLWGVSPSHGSCSSPVCCPACVFLVGFTLFLLCRCV